jgi:hypothetical protein
MVEMECSKHLPGCTDMQTADAAIQDGIVRLDRYLAASLVQGDVNLVAISEALASGRSDAVGPWSDYLAEASADVRGTKCRDVVSELPY